MTIERLTRAEVLDRLRSDILRRDDPVPLLMWLDLLDEPTPAPTAPEGAPPECPTGKHDWYTHEYNTPCYGWDGEINLPPGTVHCRSCFKVKGARRRDAQSTVQPT